MNGGFCSAGFFFLASLLLLAHDISTEASDPRERVDVGKDAWSSTTEHLKFTAASATPSEPPLKIFLMVGQSNMQGHGFMDTTDETTGKYLNGTLEWMVETFPETYGKLQTTGQDGTTSWNEREDVYIAYNRQDTSIVRPQFQQHGRLVPGYGGGSPGDLGHRIGPELGFGWTIGDALRDQKREEGKDSVRFLLLKMAWGGKSLAVDFRPPSASKKDQPTGLYYTAVLADIFKALGELEAFVPGYTRERGYELAGLAWHQGWNDGCDRTMAAEYESNLADLIRDFRRDLGVPKLPVVVGVSGMTGWHPDDPTRTVIANAQLAVANATEYREFEGTVATAETRDFYRPVEASPGEQIYHWNNNCESYWLVGAAMGKAMIDLVMARQPRSDDRHYGIGSTSHASFHGSSFFPPMERIVSEQRRKLWLYQKTQGASHRITTEPAERALRIHRGGAKFFVNDDDNGSDNDIGAGDKRNGMQKDTAAGTGTGLRRHSPVVYQYFGRSRSRGGQSYQEDAPLNFILLGPNVDHWKVVGQTLASRGFNVMACERMAENPRFGNDGGNDGNKHDDYHDAPEVVLEILDALKWEKAILVGCDAETSLAMETAMFLAPDRVAGLVLCGDLTAANKLAEEFTDDKYYGPRVLDSFLHSSLDCPFVIVWDGGARSIVSGSSAHEAIETKYSPFDNDGMDGRCVILGGGSAPHRTKPEYFAWVLARFVEEKLEYHSMEYNGGKQSSVSIEPSMDADDPLKGSQNKVGFFLQNLNLPFGIDSLVSPEGRLLLGRAVAAAIFYTSAMKVIFVQYGILRSGWISIKNSVDSVAALRGKLFQVAKAFVLNLGYIPRLFKLSLKRTKELDDDEIDRNSSKAAPIEKENEENPDDSSSTRLDDDTTGDIPNDDEADSKEDNSRIKPLFFLDNIFT